MIIKRKEFLKMGSLATAASMVPGFLRAFERPGLVPAGNRVVVVIQLSGGNDGLNTVVPVRNDVYYRSRPRIGISADKALRLTEDVSLHPALGSFRELYDAGNLSILNSVGYPNPDRSHFRSMDIWQSAADSKDYLNTGWIGRYLDAQCKSCSKPTQAVEIDDMLSLALKGEHNNGLAFKDPVKLYRSSNDPFFKDLHAAHQPGEATADYLYKTLSGTLSSADYIYQKSRLHPTSATYPATALGKDLKTIASLIFSDINTQVYYVSLGSFDTHINQDNQQKKLFTELSDAVKVFTADLQQHHRFEDVLMMTFSEFGRRVTQNASGGTDHGTANNMFFIGGGLKQKGLLNEMPDLENLTDGDLMHTVDFKNVYATVLKKWLGAEDELILGKKCNYLQFI